MAYAYVPKYSQKYAHTTSQEHIKDTYDISDLAIIFPYPKSLLFDM